MRFVLAMVLAVLGALPLSVSAQVAEDEGGSRLEDFYPGTLPESPQEFDEDRVDDFYPESARPTTNSAKFGLEYKEPESPEQRQKRVAEAEQALVKHRRGFIVSSVVLGLGIGMLVGGAVWVQNANAQPRPPPHDLFYIPWDAIALTSFGGAVVFGGLVGIGLSGSRMRARKRELRELRQAHYERVEADTSDDAFLIIVTKKYEGGELTGATVLIQHKESGQYAIPYVDGVEIDTLDQVIREYKAKLLSGE